GPGGAVQAPGGHLLPARGGVRRGPVPDPALAGPRPRGAAGPAAAVARRVRGGAGDRGRTRGPAVGGAGPRGAGPGGGAGRSAGTGAGPALAGPVLAAAGAAAGPWRHPRPRARPAAAPTPTTSGGPGRPGPGGAPAGGVPPVRGAGRGVRSPTVAGRGSDGHIPCPAMPHRKIIATLAGLAGCVAAAWGLHGLMLIGDCGGEGAPACPPEATPFAIAVAVGIPAAIISGIAGGKFTLIGLFAAGSVGALWAAYELPPADRT